jgi:hypothetical protein
MKEQLISFETAVLAKERGFNEPSKNWYNFSGLLIEGMSNTYNPSNSKKFPSYSVVSQSLLQKWLRDVHEIHVQPIFQGWADSHYSYHCKVHFIKDGIWEYFLPTKSKDTLIYEEALEIGLQQALKLIKL